MNIVTILIAILVFSLLIFIHELGHFLTAKWAGIKVNEFAIGMGPKILSFQRGETLYAWRVFPIGGFCAMEGENEDSTDNRAFCNAPLFKRIMVTVAGAIMNLVLGLLILGILSAQMKSLGSTKIAAFNENAVSSQLLQIDDEMTHINGSRVRTDNDLLYHFSRDQDGLVDIQVLRDGESVLLRAVPFEMEVLEDGSKYINLDFKVQGVPVTVTGVIRNAFNWTGSLIKQVWGSFTDLIVGRISVKQMSGPVGVTTAISQASNMGLRSLTLLVAFITVNLGVFNLLPLPALDGGRLLFQLIELVRRRPVPAKYEGAVHGVGFLLLICLMVFVTVQDVIRLATA